MHIKHLSQLKQSYDYIVIGGGSAGCVLANRLSAKQQNSVLLIEAGKSDKYFWIKIPIGYLRTIGNPRTDWCMYTNKEPGLNNRQILYARGKVIGGCSSINGMIYMRGQTQDYENWSQLLNNDPNWNWNSALEKYKQIEDYIPWDNSEEHKLFHGRGGPLRIENCRSHWDIFNVWQDAAFEKYGIPKIKEFNKGNNFGSAYFQVTQKNGFRFSVADAYLHPIKDRQNLHILKESQVEKINFVDKKAQSVQLIYKNDKNQTFSINTNKEIILSAGSIGSPQILQLSGIGNSELLRKHQIETIHELQGVGENLQDHLQIRPVFALKNAKTLNTQTKSLFGLMKIAFQFIFQRKGPITMNPSTLGAFGFALNKTTFPNIEWHLQPLSLDKFGDPLHSFDAMTTSICNLRPTSRGFVRIQSKDVSQQPEIQCNYLTSQEDKDIAVECLKICRNIMSSKAFEKFQVEEIRPGKEAKSYEDLLEGAKNYSTTIFHPSGTCKMGLIEDKNAVVDNKLRVIGIQGLRVADCSIMPYITSGNTNAPTIFIAENCAQFIQS